MGSTNCRAEGSGGRCDERRTQAGWCMQRGAGLRATFADVQAARRAVGTALLHTALLHTALLHTALLHTARMHTPPRRRVRARRVQQRRADSARALRRSSSMTSASSGG
eukprot:1754240-Prymnesium_polylepis.1